MIFKVSITKRGDTHPFWVKSVATREEAVRIAALNQRLIDLRRWDHTVAIESEPGDPSRGVAINHKKE